METKEKLNIKTKPIPGVHAPCPKCKTQLLSTTVRDELMMYCEECDEVFSLADPKVVLTKKEIKKEKK